MHFCRPKIYTMQTSQLILADRQKRFFAYLIDILPIFMLILGVFYFFLGFDEVIEQYYNRGDDVGARTEFLKQRNWIRDISFFVWLVYCIFMESSGKQATLGKMAMGIKVIKEDGRRMSWSESFSRNLSKLISYYVFFLGFIWIFFDRKKQGWHDKMNKTFVVDKKYKTPDQQA